MAAHTEISSQADFDKAIETKDKFVFIYLYENTVSPQAEEYAKKFTATTSAFKVDVAKVPELKEYLKVERVPAAVIYKGGEQVKKVEALNENREAMKEVGEMLTSA